MREGIAYYAPQSAVGVELGVATGQFSERLLSTGRFSRLYSIDAWQDGKHDQHEMSRAKALLAEYGSRSVVLRARFEDAVQQFTDDFFDFIYIDGYAHTGQDGGRTLREWWPKLKPGGVFAGDDYDPRWPATVRAVNEFLQEHGLPVKLHRFEPIPGDVWGQSPSWYAIKQ